jgi:hypothetical protein
MPKEYTSTASVTAPGVLMISGAIQGSVPRSEATPGWQQEAAAELVRRTSFRRSLVGHQRQSNVAMMAVTQGLMLSLQ